MKSFNINGKDYKAQALARNDWDFMGSYLRSCLLSDLKFIDDIQLKSELRKDIQSESYTMQDVLDNIKREDVSMKIVSIIFASNAGISKQTMLEFNNDPNFFEYFREILRDSGVTFKGDDDADNDTEAGEATNPPAEGSPSAENG